MNARELPRVSVVMPIRNEAAFIRRGLQAVLQQDYPAELVEVIVADGRSDDGTREIVGEIARQDSRVTLLDNSGRIVATGLNQALQTATGDVIVRVDGHCEIAPDYVRRCVEHLAQGGVDGVGGPLETIGRTPTARAIAAAMSSRFGVGDSAFRTVKGRTQLVDTIAFPAYTREVLDRAGPFDVELVRNQDDEYNYRIRKMGGKLLLAADVRSRYYSRSTFASLWRQYFQYGYWKVRVLEKHPLQMRARQFVPPAFVLALASAVLAAPWPGGRVWAAAVAGTYLAANIAAALFVAASHGRLLLAPRISAAFIVLHVSYGAGFLVGLASRLDRFGSLFSSQVFRRSRRLAAPEARPARTVTGEAKPN
ncbi:MAG TPA: glycosyltransferase family 2 protein [Vicinamibacterales bacterium]|nr:glycosyltransferase family 2 protein [Vicinamibacterales bacterium]